MAEASPALRVSVVQTASSLDAAENRAGLDRVADLAPDADLVVFPEAYMRDFGRAGSDLAGVAEPLDGPFVTRLRELSEAHDVAVLAGMFEAPEDAADSGDGRPWNTLVLADRGALRTYRKIHLYDSFGYCESDVLRAGPTQPVVVDVRGLRLGLMTCYDLRFPELARQLVDGGAEALVLPSAWVVGERKVAHWTTLLAARAVENVVYVVGAAQSGPRYAGHSTVLSPLGDVLATAGDEPAVVSAVLERSVLEQARHGNPSLGNRRL